jgi:hypothetical protein
VTDKLDAQIDRFFREQMLPLSAQAKSAGTRFLETGFEREAPTYYVKRSRTAMSKTDFEWGGCASPEAVEADLQALWQESADLQALGAGMAVLARALREVSTDESDVSNFIYVMF